jgi:hypothetical protein
MPGIAKIRRERRFSLGLSFRPLSPLEQRLLLFQPACFSSSFAKTRNTVLARKGRGALKSPNFMSSDHALALLRQIGDDGHAVLALCSAFGLPPETEARPAD